MEKISEKSNIEKITIARLYPELNEQQLFEAEYNLLRYLEIVWGIFERQQNLTDEQ